MSSTQVPDKYRLPVNVKPTHYDITIRTDLEKLVFRGFVKVKLDVHTETSTIVLHVADLELSDVTVYSDALKQELKPSGQTIDTASERATFELGTTLPAGSVADVRIAFNGKLGARLAGYYRSTWKHDGKTEYYAVTQFEPTDARRAFPCWDEPLLKATFALNLVSRADTTNLNNMPVLSEEIYSPQDADIASLFSFEDHVPSDWKITKFETTPPMSTYIVAFANGKFEYLESSYKSPLSGKTRPLRIYATSDLISQAQYALDVKAAVLPLYEKIFDIEYPLPKLDTLVASEFNGAMENWGLIIGETSAFLLDPQSADVAARKLIAVVQSHEVAHMWFGNIATMEWWDNLYLNEGFATVMSEAVVSVKAFPELNVDSDFIQNHLNRALSLDAKLSSHPIEVEILDSNNINEIFDALSYSKAAAVLRMLSNYLGEESFLKGVSLYMKKHLYANSVTKDLWEGISEASGVDIVNIMENWIKEMGFPVLTVTETKDGIHVRQDRFLETGPANAQDNKTIWATPLSILTVDASGQGSVDNAAMLDTREKFFPLDVSRPYKLNAGSVGVYRVLYTPDRLRQIALEAAKDNSALSLGDRVGLFYDVMSLAKAGFTDISSALTLINIWRNEKEYLVWNSILQNISNLVSLWWENDHIVGLLDAFRCRLLVPLVEKLGYEYPDNESADISQLRTAAITQAASAGDPSVIKELTGRFHRFLTSGDSSSIPADLQRPIYRAAVRHGGRAEYDAVKKIFEDPPSPTAYRAASIALGASEDPALTAETIQFLINDVGPADIMYFFMGLQQNFKARRLLTEIFKTHYDVFYKRVAGTQVMAHVLSVPFTALASDKDCRETKEFFEGKDTSKYTRTLAQILDTIRAQAALVERSTADVQTWLEAQDK